LSDTLVPITPCSARSRPKVWRFEGNAPLWFYVLAEAQHEWGQRAKQKGSKRDEEPLTLGAVGGRIVAETLIGLLWGTGDLSCVRPPIGNLKATCAPWATYFISR